MRRGRLISLYFASVGARQAFVLVSALLPWLFGRGEAQRAKLHDEVRRRFPLASVFSYTSARGALAACLSAAKIGPGDEVLLSSFTCLAVPIAVMATGATPTYCDIDSRTLNVTVDSVLASITARTRAVVVQHTLGTVAPIEDIYHLLSERGILVIEDCALAIGTRRHDRMTGSLGHAAIFSMELSKTISVGWGGILVVNSPKLARKVTNAYQGLQQLPIATSVRMLVQAAISGICYQPSICWVAGYVVAICFKAGFFKPSSPAAENLGAVTDNFVAKLAGPQAALGTHQWKRLDVIALSCEYNGTRIRRLLTKLGYVPLGSFDDDYFSVSPRVSFLVANRASIMQWFSRRGVELGAWFDGPLSPLPEAALFNYEKIHFRHASFIADHIVNIPSHSRLASVDLEKIEVVLEEYASAHPEDLVFQRQLLGTSSH